MALDVAVAALAVPRGVVEAAAFTLKPAGRC
jgi:hypothetical protein